MQPLYRQRLITGLKNRPNAVFFDWDDTLADHHETCLAIIRDILAEQGKEEYKALLTTGKLSGNELAFIEKLVQEWYDNKTKCCAEYFNCSVEYIKDAYRRRLDALPVETTKLFKDTIPLLESLKEAGIPIAIVSNKSQKRLEDEIACTRATKYFSAIIGYTDGMEIKPDPQPLIRTLRALWDHSPAHRENLQLDNIWFVGDSLEDMGAGRADGIQRFHIGSFQRNLVQRHIEHNDPSGKIILLKDLREFKEQFIDHINPSLVVRL